GVPAAAVKLPVHQVHLAYAGLMWMPLVIAAAFCAWRYMDSISDAKADTASYAKALRHGQTWVMSLLYIGTFGSFIGYAFALPLVIKNTFPEFLGQHPFIATYLAGLGFVGALIGSLARPLGGWLSDRLGGARVTLACFAGMGAFTAVAIAGVNRHSFALFFAELGRRDPKATLVEYKRRAAAAIGICGAVGAFGGFLIQVAFRQASLST